MALENKVIFHDLVEDWEAEIESDEVKKSLKNKLWKPQVYR